MFRLHFLGSGSSGNSLLIRVGETTILVDCGFTGKDLHRRASLLGQNLDRIDAILLTHEHRDHVSGLAGLASITQAVYSTEGTARAVYFGRRSKAERIAIRPGKPFQVGPLSVQAFSTSHDARDPVGYVLTAPDGTRLGIATDLGTPSQAVEEALADCDLLGLESNHDLQMLADGPYPWVLKQRIRSDRGHLSNPTAAGLLERLVSDRLQHLFALHLSQTNNTPGLAKLSLTTRLSELGLSVPVTVIAQDRPLSHPPGGQLTLL